MNAMVLWGVFCGFVKNSVSNEPKSSKIDIYLKQQMMTKSFQDHCTIAKTVL